MVKIVTPAIRKIYKDIIKQTVEDLHKPIVAYLPPEKADCPNCIWSSATQSSTGKFDSSFVAPVVIFGNTINPKAFTTGRCPVCRNVGFLQQEVTRNLKALVKWNPSGAQDLQILAAGREGNPTVRIKVLRSNYENIMNATHFSVDGVKCEILKPPTIRALGQQEELVIVYLQAVEVGKDVKRE